jgi:hypothetical protein
VDKAPKSVDRDRRLWKGEICHPVSNLAGDGDKIGSDRGPAYRPDAHVNNPATMTPAMVLEYSTAARRWSTGVRRTTEQALPPRPHPYDDDDGVRR